MNRIALSVALAFTPAMLAAQSAQAHAHGDANAGVKTKPAQMSASTTVDAEIAIARDRGLPTRPIERRAAEARAKGRTEAEAALAARELRVNLQSAHGAIVRAGRPRPSEDEVERGGYAIERGYTHAQVEAIARVAPADRSLVVAFDVLSRLVARGVANENALAQVQSRLEARASDAQIEGLVTAAANANANANLGAGAAGAAAKGGVNAGAAASGAAGGASSGAAGAVGGTVGGIIRRP